MRLKWSLNSSHPGFISRSLSAFGAVALSAICRTHESTLEPAPQRYRQALGLQHLVGSISIGASMHSLT